MVCGSGPACTGLSETAGGGCPADAGDVAVCRSAGDSNSAHPGSGTSRDRIGVAGSSQDRISTGAQHLPKAPTDQLRRR